MENQQYFQHPSFPKVFISKDGKVFIEYDKCCKLANIYLDRYGYLEVNSPYAMVPARRKLHRLLADCFIKGSLLDRDEIVSHKDFNKINNQLDNLEIVSIYENNNKPDRKNIKYQTPLTTQLEILPLILENKNLIPEISIKYGLSLGTLYAAREGRTWKRAWKIFRD